MVPSYMAIRFLYKNDYIYIYEVRIVDIEYRYSRQEKMAIIWWRISLDANTG